jgi:hypothetical protein
MMMMVVVMMVVVGGSGGWWSEWWWLIIDYCWWLSKWLANPHQPRGNIRLLLSLLLSNTITLIIITQPLMR